MRIELTSLKIFSGSLPKTCADADTGTRLLEMEFAPGAAFIESGPLRGGSPRIVLPEIGQIPIEATHFRLYGEDTVCHVQGTIFDLVNGTSSGAF